MDCSFHIGEHHLTIESAALLRYWRERREKGPVEKSDFSAMFLRRWLGDVAIVQREHAPVKHRMRLVGSNVARHIGTGRTGLALEDYIPELSIPAITDPYHTAFAADAPVLSRMTPAVGAHSNFRWLDRLILPVTPHNDEIEALYYVWMDVDTDEHLNEATIYDGVSTASRAPIEHHAALSVW